MWIALFGTIGALALIGGLWLWLVKSTKENVQDDLIAKMSQAERERVNAILKRLARRKARQAGTTVPDTWSDVELRRKEGKITIRTPSEGDR